MKKVNKTTAEYIEEMKESARMLAKKCDIASDFHSMILEKYKYDYKERNENAWNYEEAIIAKEIVKAIEKALEDYCFLD